MNVKQKLKRKRKKAWKKRIHKARYFAAKIDLAMVDKKMWQPGYNFYNKEVKYFLLDATRQIVMEGNLIEVEDYLDRLWKMRVFL
jgi:hypothetical protein